MKSAIFFFLVSLSCCFAGIATEPVTVQVDVTNETTGTFVISDPEVVLTVYKDNQLLDRKKGQLNSDGICSFEDVPTGSGVVAVATAKNQGMMFSSRPASLEHAHEEVFRMSISAYDVSTDTSALSVGTHHFVIRIDPQGVFVNEYIQIVNDSEKAITSEKKAPDGKPMVLEVFLPTGFKDVKCSKYFEEHALVTTDQGFFDTMAVPPGRHDAVFTYRLEPDSSTLTISKKAGLPTKDFMVFAQLSGAQIEGLGQPLGKMTLNNGLLADYFPSVSLESGQSVTFQITGLNITKDEDDLWIMLGIIFGAIVLVGLARTLVQRKRQ